MRTFIFCLFIALTTHAHAQICGKVVRLDDGDSFTILTDENKRVRIRLHGIDCPENGQPYSHKGKEFVAEVIDGKRICLDSLSKDRYGRVVAILHTTRGAGLTLNSMLIAQGLAWHYKYYDQNPEWAELEDKARAQKIGLWTEPNPVAPWDWRKLKK